jgi:lactoylglutathione lyase
MSRRISGNNVSPSSLPTFLAHNNQKSKARRSSPMSRESFLCLSTKLRACSLCLRSHPLASSHHAHLTTQSRRHPRRRCRAQYYVLSRRPEARSSPAPRVHFPGAWFRIGADQELHLIGERKAEVISHNRGNHYAMLVDDIDAWEQHLTTIGAKFFPRRIRPDGAYQIFLCDPDGYYIELCTPPGAAVK